MKKKNVNLFYMIKEFLHICRTYSVTFRYLKKNEIFFIYLLTNFLFFNFFIFLTF